MALVVLPDGYQISGSSGGTTWSRNRFGAYKRNRSVPVNPNSSGQVAVRNALRQLTILWQTTLTQLQRDAWKTYADNVVWKNHLGQDILLTALNHYLRSNLERVRSSLTRVDDAPTTFNLGEAEQALVGSASEATQTYSIAYDDTAAWASEDDAHQLFYAGLPQNPGINFFGGPWRLLGVVDGDSVTPPTSPYAPAAVFPFAQNQRLWIRTRIARADGRLSEFAQHHFLAGA